MKKIVSLLLCICIVCTIFTMPTIAATSTKLSTAELNIVKEYQKTIETNDAKYINAYKYPGVTFKMQVVLDKSLVAKILNPTYSKVYDSKLKLYKLSVSGITVVTNGEKLILASTKYGIYVKTNGKKLCTYKVAPNENEKLLEVINLTDSQQTVLEKYLASLYDADTASTLMYPDEGGTGKDKGNGTIESPIALKQKYTWTATDKKYAYDMISGTFSLTVNSSKKITTTDVQKLGFKKPADNDKYEYYLVNATYEVKNAKIKKGDKGLGYCYLSSGWALDIWGTKNSDGNGLIGGCSDYFDGGIGKKIYSIDKKVTVGMAGQSFKVTGNVLLSVLKGDTYYMCLRNEEIEDYDSSFVYFKFK